MNGGDLAALDGPLEHRAGFLKDATAAELVHAVTVVAAGEALLAPSVTRRLIAEFAHRPATPPPVPTVLHVLTDREAEVLRLVARGQSNGEISSALVIAEQTVVLAYESGLVTPSG